jgi:hypothetical protein
MMVLPTAASGNQPECAQPPTYQQKVDCPDEEGVLRGRDDAYGTLGVYDGLDSTGAQGGDLGRLLSIIKPNGNPMTVTQRNHATTVQIPLNHQPIAKNQIIRRMILGIR